MLCQKKFLRTIQEPNNRNLQLISKQLHKINWNPIVCFYFFLLEHSYKSSHPPAPPPAISHKTANCCVVCGALSGQNRKSKTVSHVWHTCAIICSSLSALYCVKCALYITHHGVHPTGIEFCLADVDVPLPGEASCWQPSVHKACECCSYAAFYYIADLVWVLMGYTIGRQTGKRSFINHQNALNKVHLVNYRYKIGHIRNQLSLFMIITNNCHINLISVYKQKQKQTLFQRGLWGGPILCLSFLACPCWDAWCWQRRRV